MRQFKKISAQGDVYIMKVDMEVPAGSVNVEPSGEWLIVTHSETGHHHVMDREKVRAYTLPDSIMNLLLVVDEPTELVHLRDHDTHEPISFEKGTYIVRRQREYTAEGFRAVQD
jgi:hypothetical protein